MSDAEKTEVDEDDRKIYGFCVKDFEDTKQFISELRRVEYQYYNQSVRIVWNQLHECYMDGLPIPKWVHDAIGKYLEPYFEKRGENGERSETEKENEHSRNHKRTCILLAIKYGLGRNWNDAYADTAEALEPFPKLRGTEHTIYRSFRMWRKACPGVDIKGYGERLFQAGVITVLEDETIKVKQE